MSNFTKLIYSDVLSSSGGLFTTINSLLLEIGLKLIVGQSGNSVPLNRIFDGYKGHQSQEYLKLIYFHFIYIHQLTNNTFL